MQAGKNWNGGDPEYDVELMAEKQFSASSRLRDLSRSTANFPSA